MYVGLDVHQKTIDVTIAEDGRDGKVWRFGTIGGDLRSVDRMVDKLLTYKRPLHFVYEAGPCGFVLYRHLKERAQDCTVVAPAAVPKKASDRVKTDRRDATSLATSHRAGQLRAIYVPEPGDEAIRDVVRAREDALYARRQARQQLNSFLLRHGRRYTKSKWTIAHRRWLSDQIFDLAAERVTFEEYIQAIEECEKRVERLDRHIETAITDWRFLPLVRALQALRGVSLIVAVTVVAEIGDMTRFRPRELMAFLGMIPSEYSSGDKRRLGSITKCGNGHVRRVLCEAAWAYDNMPKISRHLLKRQEGLPQEVIAAAWKAQIRLCGRFRRLNKTGKHRNKINTAIARELAGFMWHIAMLVDGKQPIKKEPEAEVYILKRKPSKTPGRRRIRIAAPAA
jgi:transposase